MPSSSASAGSSGGRIPGSRAASIDFPAPGGPTIKRLWPPAAATSRARLSQGDGALNRELETCRKRAGEIEAELARRVAGGAASDHVRAEWVQKDPPG